MLYILDWLFFERIYGKEFPYKGKPVPFFSDSFLHNIRIDAQPSAFYNSIRKYVKMHISNFSKNQLSLSHKFRVVGIDLAGKVDSRTGMCLLINSVAETTVAHTDDDIIEFIRTSHPDLISIDAPLSLPKGRNSVYDDDSTRVSAGIMRYCERVLKTRNVNCYPALIRSMQELTKRGIKLAELFRASGYPVIECFPGAAQDVIQLPRKRTDETLLKHGLSEFGIKGGFRSKKVCHDELDAITAALVGQFFISEFYEPLGIPEENDMIIPRKERTIPRHSIVIGLAGPIATGKTEAGRWIENLGFHYIRYSQIIEKKLIDSNNKVTRNDLRREGWNVYSGCRQYQLNQRLSEAICEYSPVVIDGMRHLEDFTYWKESGFLRFVLVYIDSDRELRKQRFESRSDDSVSYDVAVSHPVEAHVELLRNKADYIVHNNGSIDGLHRELNIIISKIIKSQKSLAMTI